MKAIFKGFDFGKSKVVVGAVHRRGAVIRNNLSRCCDEADPDYILSFMKAVDILIEYGSSASTRTKDEAMSLNIHPDNPIGKQIIDTVMAAVYAHKQSGRSNGS